MDKEGKKKSESKQETEKKDSLKSFTNSYEKFIKELLTFQEENNPLIKNTYPKLETLENTILSKDTSNYQFSDSYFDYGMKIKKELYSQKNIKLPDFNLDYNTLIGLHNLNPHINPKPKKQEKTPVIEHENELELSDFEPEFEPFVPNENLIKFFQEGNKDMRDLMGGKGANLAEMTNIGLPVPAGFTITTEAYKAFEETGELSSQLKHEILKAISQLETETNTTFGGENPLLVSVRSGAPVSMPGMMDTIINIGMNQEVTATIADKFTQTYAQDSYNKLLETYVGTIIKQPIPKLETIIKQNQEALKEDKQLISYMKKELKEYVINKIKEVELTKEDQKKLLSQIKKAKVKQEYMSLKKELKNILLNSETIVKTTVEGMKQPKKVFEILAEEYHNETKKNIEIIGTAKTATTGNYEKYNIQGLKGRLEDIDGPQHVELEFDTDSNHIQDWFSTKAIKIVYEENPLNEIIEELLPTKKGKWNIGDKVIGIENFEGEEIIGLEGVVIETGTNPRIKFTNKEGKQFDWYTPKSHLKNIDSKDFQELEEKFIQKYFSEQSTQIVELKKQALLHETGGTLPNNPKKQLLSAITAVFESWNNKRAKEYRKMNGISDDIGTAVNVQMMVFGNKGNTSGTGVCFTRNPSTGEKELYGEYLINAQGEDIVAGIRTPQPISLLKSELPAQYNQLVEIANMLEGHYKDMQDIEFTIDNGELYILQTRNGKRTNRAATKMLVDFAEEGLITKEDAIKKFDLKTIENMFTEQIDPTQKYTKIGKGTSAATGIVSGVIALTSKQAQTYAKDNNVILIREETTPEDITGIKASKGILTKIGGATSHAAVLTRAMNKCCITGCNEIEIDSNKLTINGKTYQEGDEITLNGYTGEIIEGKVKTIKDSENPSISKLEEWANELIENKIEVNVDTPKEIKAYVGKSKNKPIGLMRTDHLFFTNYALAHTIEYVASNEQEDRDIELQELEKKHNESNKAAIQAANGNDMRIQLLSVPIKTFLPTTDEMKILSRNLVAGGKYEQAKEGKKNTSKYNPELMIPIYEMQTKSINDSYDQTNKPSIEVLIPQAVPKKYRTELQERLQGIITEGNNITITTNSEQLKYIGRNDEINLEEMTSSDVVIMRPQNMIKTKLGIAQNKIFSEICHNQCYLKKEKVE